MFNRFTERYLCAVHKIGRLGQKISVGTYSSIGNIYHHSINQERADPLSIMLKGTICTGNIYDDYAREFAVPVEAMQCFRDALFCRETIRSSWLDRNPETATQLTYFGNAIYCLMNGSKGYCRQYLDSVSDLKGKEKVKDLAIESYVAGTPFSPLRLW